MPPQITGKAAFKNRPRLKSGRLTALRQLLALQEVAFKAAIEPKVKPRDIAALSLAWERLEERKRVLRGKPLPGSLKPEPKVRPGRSKAAWSSPVELELAPPAEDRATG